MKRVRFDNGFLLYSFSAFVAAFIVHIVELWSGLTMDTEGAGDFRPEVDSGGFFPGYLVAGES